MARLAAVALAGADEDQVSVGMRLLGDIRDVFAGDDHLPTAELLRRLHELEDAPWGDWYGSPLSARAWRSCWGPTGSCRSCAASRAGDAPRGYFRSDFTDAWSRYSLPAQKTLHGVTSVPADDAAARALALFDEFGNEEEMKMTTERRYGHLQGLRPDDGTGRRLRPSSSTAPGRWEITWPRTPLPAPATRRRAGFLPGLQHADRHLPPRRDAKRTAACTARRSRADGTIQARPPSRPATVSSPTWPTFGHATCRAGHAIETSRTV